MARVVERGDVGLVKWAKRPRRTAKKGAKMCQNKHVPTRARCLPGDTCKQLYKEKCTVSASGHTPDKSVYNSTAHRQAFAGHVL